MNNPMILANVKEDFYLNFIKDDRYLWLLDGLKTTLIITVFAVIVGLIIGFLVAIIRSAHDKSGSFKILNAICRVYLTVIRGTPTMISVVIMITKPDETSDRNGITLNKVLISIAATTTASTALFCFAGGIIIARNIP